MTSKEVYGIDLGTTFSAIAKLNEIGQPEIIPNSDGDRITASAIFFDNQDLTVGSSAIHGAYLEHQNFIQHIKHHMEDADYRVEINGKTYSPAQISSFILRKLTQDAGKQAGHAIQDVIITIPANFADVARTATIEAGKLAGLNVLGLVNEPTAAIVNAALSHNLNGITLIFDLGGGTFDITIAEIKDKEINIIASGGDRAIGGVNFDEVLVNYFKEEYKKETGNILFKSPSEKLRVIQEVIEIKKQLSKKEEVRFAFDKQDYYGKIKRSVFEKLISEYTARIEMLIENLIEDAKITSDKIDHILPVGGSSRIPCMKNIIIKITGKEPLSIGNVDESVALGAAISAGVRKIKKQPESISKSIQEGLSGVSIKDITPRNFGTKSLNIQKGKTEVTNAIILKKGISIPCSHTETFYTVAQNQSRIKAEITQTDDPNVPADIIDVVAEASFDLPPNTPEGSKILVTYSYDEDGIMTASFEHIDSGKILEFKGNPTSNNQKTDQSSLNTFEIE